MSKNSRLSNVEVLRCFAVLSLVAWHCLCVYVGWRRLLPDITAAVGDSIITKWYTTLSKIIFMPDANMPLFVIISGFVYSFLWNGGGV